MAPAPDGDLFSVEGKLYDLAVPSKRPYNTDDKVSVEYGNNLAHDKLERYEEKIMCFMKILIFSPKFHGH